MNRKDIKDVSDFVTNDLDYFARQLIEIDDWIANHPILKDEIDISDLLNQAIRSIHKSVALAFESSNKSEVLFTNIDHSLEMVKMYELEEVDQ